MLAHKHSGNNASTRRSGVGRAWLVFAGFAAIALLLTSVEHRAHLLGWLPWLFLLACPLMHIFMHGSRRHGGHHGRGKSAKRDENE